MLVLLMWWYHPFSQLLGRFDPGPYDFSGPVFPAATVMALALGLAAGALTRRTVSAIFLTLVLVLAIRAPVELFLRPNFEPQVTITWPIAQGGQSAGQLERAGLADWTGLRGFAVDELNAALRRLSTTPVRRDLEREERRVAALACDPQGVAMGRGGIPRRTATERQADRKKDS